MIAAGEDPRFIVRRLIISASEDVGNADPRALQVAVAAAQALDHVGLPEAQYALAQATTYIASAPKSNRSGAAYFAAVADLDEHGALPVPLHLRSAGHPAMKHYGHGVGYRFPPEFEGSDIDQLYLPEELADRHYYQPDDQGYEATIGAGWRPGPRRARPPGWPAGRSGSPSPGPAVDSMKAGASIMRTREANRKKLADTEKKRDAERQLAGWPWHRGQRRAFVTNSRQSGLIFAAPDRRLALSSRTRGYLSTTRRPNAAAKPFEPRVAPSTGH